MKPVQRMPDNQLQYVRDDCLEAVKAHPAGNGSLDYIFRAQDCMKELERRDRIRTLRKTIADGPCDKLTIPVRRRGWIQSGHRAYLADRVWNANWLLGWESGLKRKGVVL